MGKRNSKGGSKKSKSKKHREHNNKFNELQKEEKNSQEVRDENFCEDAPQDSVKEDADDIKVDPSTAKTPMDANPEINPPTPTPDDTYINDCSEEIKAKQQELINKLGNLSAALTSITLIRDNVNSIRVDTLTELYFIRQVRPLLDALNIIAFSSLNISNTAAAFQLNAFGDRKEIKDALKLSYKMNNEVDDIINVLGRRLKIFLKQIDCMDRNCPPFDSNKDS